MSELRIVTLLFMPWHYIQFPRGTWNGWKVPKKTYWKKYDRLFYCATGTRELCLCLPRYFSQLCSMLGFSFDCPIFLLTRALYFIHEQPTLIIRNALNPLFHLWFSKGQTYQCIDTIFELLIDVFSFLQVRWLDKELQRLDMPCSRTGFDSILSQVTGYLWS